MLGIGSLFISDDIDEAGPAAADADDSVSLMDGPESDGADSRVQSRHIAASGENADGPFFVWAVCHFELLFRCGLLEWKIDLDIFVRPFWSIEKIKPEL
jgi:hypothetical protein